MDPESSDVEIYNRCCNYYKYVEEISTDYYININEASDIFDVLQCENFVPMYMNIDEIIDGIKFYNKILEKIKLIESYSDIVDVYEYFFVTNLNSKHLESKYNIVQYTMKIIIHLLWQYLYKLAPRLMDTPEEAIGDILCPIEASQREVKKIMFYLEQKHNIKILKY